MSTVPESPASHRLSAGESAAPASARGEAGSCSIVLSIPTMDCAVEENELRRALEPIAGIRRLRFQLGKRLLTIDAERDVLSQALRAIDQAGFDAQPLPAVESPSVDSQASSGAHGHGHGHAPPVSSLRLAAALALALGAEVLHWFAADLPALTWLGLALAVMAIGLAGLDVYHKGLAALRRGKLNINALMSVAVTGALLIGQWPEAAMVMALYAIAERIEARAADRARHAIEGLVALAPEQVEVRQPDGAWRTMPSAEVTQGAVVRVRPGERLPLDGVITQGASAIDQAAVTGESLPVERTVGEAVFAGTINQTGELTVRVTAPASGSTLARIIHAVEAAQSTRAPTQRLVDRFAAVYTPAVFVLALMVALALPLLFGVPWLDAVYKALVLLVVACPCALVISTPVTVVSALAAAARRGILIKGGSYLEDARRLNAVALDKTGTITEGRPKLVEWTTLPAATDRARIGKLAASLASRSDHPVSTAIAEALARELMLEAAPVEGFTALAGQGVQGVIGGQALVLGNHRLIEEWGWCGPDIEALLAAHERQGRTVSLLADEAQGVLAIFAVADTIKPSSRAAVAELQALGVTPVLLSGDNAATAASIAVEAGIGEARGGLLPEDKLTQIEALQKRHGLVAMVGDGINDAPALAKSSIGFAMGGAGTDIAMEAADVVIMNDDLRRIPETIWLSRRTHNVLVQNIALALGIKAVFMVLALIGSATMWMAVFADMGATLLVVGNGLRLLRADRRTTE